jgi:hypothetical protein
MILCEFKLCKSERNVARTMQRHGKDNRNLEDFRSNHSPGIPPTGFASRVDEQSILGHYSGMSTLAEIEKAAENLSPQQKQELILFLGARLRAERATLPEPRQFSREQVQSWVDEDKADLKRFREQS